MLVQSTPLIIYTTTPYYHNSQCASFALLSQLSLPLRQARDIAPTFSHSIYKKAMAGITKESVNAIISLVDGPVMELMRDVIKQEDSCQILQTDLRRMENFLQDMITMFRDEVDIAAFIQDHHEKTFLEMVKTWLQLLHNSLTEAERLLSIDNWGTRRRCVDWIVNNPRRPSKQIRHWNAFFDHLYRSFQSDFSILVTSLQFVSAKPLYKEEALLQGVAASGFVGSGIKDAQAQVERWLNERGQIHVIGVYGTPGVGKTSLLEMLYNHEVSNVFDRKIWVTVPQDCNSFDLQGRILNKIFNSIPDSFDERKMELSAYLEQQNFLLVLDDLFGRLDLQEVGVAFGDGKHSKVLFSTCRKDLIGEIGAEEFIEIQPLSQDEGWMLFRRVAFKDDQVPVDIEERARNVADECKGLPLTINVVGAAMMGKTSAHEWDICLASMRNVDPSFPAATPASYLDAQLYARLRYGYDALPNSDVKRCFLYCAMYSQGEKIDTHTLLQMWIGEGLVKSKQGTYLMDMAIGRKYLKLLVDRRLFPKVKQSTDVFEQRTIRVSNCIHDMSVYIGQTEENFLFMPSQHQRNFPVVHDENCSRMLVASNSMEHLPTELRCPKLASLSLQGISHLKELPSDFLPSVTSLTVLNLSGCTQITSIPTSIGQLRMLQFLSLHWLRIKELPEEICQLSKLQFLDLSSCGSLNSLPSQIGQLRNLKHLNLVSCMSLKMIPREMSELTSLSRLQVDGYTHLSVEVEAPTSIWCLKGLESLTELEIWIDTLQQDGKRSRIKDGIMGTWSEMRHLQLLYDDSYEEDLLPEDMQNMKNLQSFDLRRYEGLRLPNCKFEHLEMVQLVNCHGIRELSPLERLPNLKVLKLWKCKNLRELGIGSPNGYVRLQKLVLRWLDNLEYLDGAPNWGVWDERTLPQLRVLKIGRCPSLKRFPKGMEKLRNLSALMSSEEWWESIMWEDDDMKGKLQKFFIPREGRRW